MAVPVSLPTSMENELRAIDGHKACFLGSNQGKDLLRLAHPQIRDSPEQECNTASLSLESIFLKQEGNESKAWGPMSKQQQTF